MSRLSTHVLDTYHGQPARGLAFALYRIEPPQPVLVVEGITDADGRALLGEELPSGTYELVFFCGDYWRGRGVALSQPAFLDTVPVRFGMEAGRYHVPLLCSPWSYSTYRGS